MRRLILFCFLPVIFLGCQFASESYQPGIRGVRDNPVSDQYLNSGSRSQPSAVKPDYPTYYF